MIYLIVYLIIATVVILITGTLVAVLVRRYYMGRRYRALDEERERYSVLLIELDSGVRIEDAAPYRRAQGGAAWTAVEENLLKALEGPGSSEAARLLTELGYAGYYMKRLKARRKWEQAMAAERLGRMRCAKAVPALIEALASENRDLKLMAIYSLGRIGDEAAIPPLLGLMRLAITTEEDISLRILKSALLSFGPLVMRDLLAELESPDWRMRSTALDMLCELGSRELGPRFLRLLEDPEQDVRAKAAKGLGRIGYGGATGALTNALNDGFWVVRLHSARALGLIGDASAAPELKAALLDKNWQVRDVAAEALGRLGGMAIADLLTVFVDSTDRYASDQALDELCRIGLYDRIAKGLTDPEVLFLVKENHAPDDMVDDKEKSATAYMLHFLSTLSEERLSAVLASLSGGEGPASELALVTGEIMGLNPRPRAADRSGPAGAGPPGQ